MGTKKINGSLIIDSNLYAEGEDYLGDTYWKNTDTNDSSNNFWIDSTAVDNLQGSDTSLHLYIVDQDGRNTGNITLNGDTLTNGIDTQQTTVESVTGLGEEFVLFRNYAIIPKVIYVNNPYEQDPNKATYYVLSSYANGQGNRVYMNKSPSSLENFYWDSSTYDQVESENISYLNMFLL